MKIRIVLLLLLMTSQAGAAMAQPLATAPVQSLAAGGLSSADGVVEAVRQTVLAAQVQGAIIELRVKPGEAVKAGQVLVRIDARAADQSALASGAQVQAARASLEVASRDFNRQKLLFQRGFISQAALDQAEAVYKAAEAQVNAQIAQAGAATAQSDFHTLRAPYAGIVADVPVVQGDMAMPGKPLLTIYDPTAMRVTASVPQTTDLPDAAARFKVELPGGASSMVTPVRVTLLPTADPNTHTLQLRLDLPDALKPAAAWVPGAFARAWYPRTGAGDPARVSVPASAVVRRAELTGLYVVDGAGKPWLRQVRLGNRSGDSVEVLAGVSAGERVATDPQAAARIH
jgi:RND family efflux transporter MFP subunit